MPVAMLVRNNQEGPSVFTDPKSKQEYTWEGKDDPNGGDIQSIPSDLAEDYNFAKAVRVGIFEVVEADDATKELLDKQTTAWRNRMQADADSIQASIDESQKQDYIVLDCVGPNARGNGVCGEPVPVKEAHKDDKAPLCAQHEALRAEFVSTPTDKLVEGKAVVKWERIPMGAPEKQSNQTQTSQ